LGFPSRQWAQGIFPLEALASTSLHQCAQEGFCWLWPRSLLQPWPCRR